MSSFSPYAFLSPSGNKNRSLKQQVKCGKFIFQHLFSINVIWKIKQKNQQINTLIISPFHIKRKVFWSKDFYFEIKDIVQETTAGNTYPQVKMRLHQRFRVTYNCITESDMQWNYDLLSFKHPTPTNCLIKDKFTPVDWQQLARSSLLHITMSYTSKYLIPLLKKNI